MIVFSLALREEDVVAVVREVVREVPVLQNIVERNLALMGPAKPKKK